MKTMTKKALSTFLLLFFISQVIFAEGTEPVKNETKVYTISGKIVDQKTGEPLTGVKVFYPGSDLAVYTDFDGEFTIQATTKKDAQLSVSLISYEIKTIKLDKSKKVKLELNRQK